MLFSLALNIRCYRILMTPMVIYKKSGIKLSDTVFTMV